MFDKLLENIDTIADKLGLPADQVKNITDSLTAKLSEGDHSLASLIAFAEEQGLPVDKLQHMLGDSGLDGNELMEKAGSLLGGGKEGVEDALGGVMDSMKGLLGRN